MNRSSAPYPQNLVNDIFPMCDQPVDCILNEDEQNRLDLVLQEFGVKDRTIVLLYYKDNLSMREIAKQFDISVSRIRQILEKSIRRLRHPDNLKRFWDDYRKWVKQSLKKVNCINCTEHKVINGKVCCTKHNIEVDPYSSCELIEYINNNRKEESE